MTMEVQGMNIRPLYDRIVVKRLDTQDEKTASGLIIPDSAKEKPQEGEELLIMREDEVLGILDSATSKAKA
jgi:chaperonin GroES